MSGSAGIGRKGKLILPRKIKKGCAETCYLKCGSRLTPGDREFAHNTYWSLEEPHDKWQCLLNWSEKTEKKNQYISYQHLNLRESA